MIRMIASESAAKAKSYFSEALAKSDYYIGDQELNGNFHGLLSERLGIKGIATKERFFALCENRHPETGQMLTPRTKKERTVGYDINFHVPKSVSILHAFAADNHILDAFQLSVNETMAEIEKETRTRVRKGGVADEDRLTSELLYVDFVHQTARPVDGFVPDPHLHAHCYVFNMTWDKVENRLKAGQFRQINQEMPFFQALFHKKLADKLVDLGYQIRPTAKSFEIVGVDPEVIALFSKRTDEIGRVAKAKGITDAKELAELGARTRARKLNGLSMYELKAEWTNQILGVGSAGKTAIANNGFQARHATRSKEAHVKLTAKDCRDFAVKHCFERASVMPFNKLVQAALKHSLGSTASDAAIIAALKGHKDIIHVMEKNRQLCTTKEVLAEEEKMVRIARRGKNRFAPLYTSLPVVKSPGQQGDAIRHVLSTTDMVSIVRGAAGAGKTTLMKEAVPLIEQAGKRVIIVAPTANASRRVLREDGFVASDTVATFLDNEKRHKDLQNGVLWVDEAGMLGTKDMTSLLQLTSKHNARLILGGDTRQHASVDRGDALRVLSMVAGIRAAEVNEIRRQRDALYRDAVKDLSSGNIADGFSKLDMLGVIYQGTKGEATDQLVHDYIGSVKKGSNALIISPTHAKGEEVTAKLRAELRAAGMLGRKEIIIDRLKALSVTEAEKTDWRLYNKGMVLQFNQNQKGIKRGSFWTVDDTNNAGVFIRNAKNERKQLDLKKAADFSIFETKALPLSKGDKVQVTKNGFDKNKERLDNGTMLTISSVTKHGDIVAKINGGKNSYILGKDFGHLAHAHCVTSHRSQGSTVDEIFIAQPSETFGATNAKQFYVSVSRARENVRIYTDDKKLLLQKASEDGNRRAALELVTTATQQIETDIRLKEVEQPRPAIGHNKGQQPPAILPEYDGYEPEF